MLERAEEASLLGDCCHGRVVVIAGDKLAEEVNIGDDAIVKGHFTVLNDDQWSCFNLIFTYRQKRHSQQFLAEKIKSSD